MGTLVRDLADAYSSVMSIAGFSQPSLLGLGDPGFDEHFTGIERIDLGSDAWVDHQPGWVRGHDTLFADLLETTTWSSHERPMYDRIVAVPRLIGEIPAQRTPHPALEHFRRALSERYEADLDRTGLALYRDGADSVAWHGDTHGRTTRHALVATVSLGEPRRFLLRPASGGPSRSLLLGHGDLVVMGGSSQRTWRHAVPKTSHAGPRICVMFRHSTPLP